MIGTNRRALRSSFQAPGEQHENRTAMVRWSAVAHSSVERKGRSVGGPTRLHGLVRAKTSRRPPPGPGVKQREPAQRLMEVASWVLANGPSFKTADVFGAFPDYTRNGPAAAEKQWTRDKDRLEKLGLPIRYVEHDHEYVVHRDEFQLPAIRFPADERAVLGMAAQAVLRLSGNPLQAELVSALRKLRCADPDAPAELALPMSRREEDLDPAREHQVEVTIRDALFHRKRVHMRYFTVWSGTEAERDVDLYGLGWRRGTWFFVGFCHLRQALRVFYPSRVREISINTEKPASPDYDIPPDFDIRQFVAQKEWDYWVHSPREAVVHLRGGLAHIATSLLPKAALEPRPDGTVCARLRVRNLGALVRQCLAWGPDAELIAPEDGRQRATAMLSLLQEALERLPAALPATSAGLPSTKRSGKKSTNQVDYLSLFRRLMILIPFVARKKKVHWKEACAFAGYRNVGELYDDLKLMAEVSIPGAGGGELIDIELHGSHVICHLPQSFSRPPRLTVQEAVALLVSLRALGDAGGDALARSIERVRRAFPAGDDDASTDALIDSLARTLAIEEPPRSPFHDVLQEAIDNGREVRLDYYAESRKAITHPVVEPVLLFARHSHWYLELAPAGSDKHLPYRADRISAVTPTGRTIEPRMPASDPANLFHFSPSATALLVFSRRLATYVREHFGEVAANPDGTSTILWPVRGTTESFVSWVLGFGGECAVSAPADLRNVLQARVRVLSRLLGSKEGGERGV